MSGLFQDDPAEPRRRAAGARGAGAVRRRVARGAAGAGACHPLPRAGAQIPPDDVRRPDRAGGDGAHVAQRLRRRPGRPRLHADRRARRRQDHHRPHHRPRAELHRSGRHRRPDRRSVRRLRQLRRHPRRPPPRRDRDGRRQPHRRGRHARGDRGHPLPPHAGAHQGLRHRRSPHAEPQRLQRAAEDAGGTAAAREVRVRDDRNPQSADHRAVALPALRPAPGADRRTGRGLLAASR